MILRRNDLEDLLLSSRGTRRFTQDSPVLPDVWLRFVPQDVSDTPHWDQPLDLLLTPYRDVAPRQLVEAVLRSFHADRGWRLATRPPRSELELSLNTAYVVGQFYFDELIRILLPLTKWWQQYVFRGGQLEKDLEPYITLEKRPTKPKDPPDDDVPLARLSLGTAAKRQRFFKEFLSKRTEGDLDDLIWLIRIVGRMEWDRRSALRSRRGKGSTSKKTPPLSKDPKREMEQLTDVCLELLDGVSVLADTPPQLWQVNLNRRVQPVLWRSVPAAKGDAAMRVFNVCCNKLRWAVLDSGIDAAHIAFRRRNKQTGDKLPLPPREDWSDDSRVSETYDFTRLRNVVAAKTMADLDASFLTGRSVDWANIRKEIRIPHRAGKYRPPRHKHGTHVAGIIGAEWRQDDDPPVPDEYDLVGMCPDINLIDVRVLDDEGNGDEFAILGALQFVRWLNSNKEQPVIHGVNLSLSLLHDAANFACGRTPVCEECERLVNSGVVVVAAAGNEGYAIFQNKRGASEGFRAISITDPGNTEAVITVGATHRFKPHTYGVSYFSSRGPTGDGRCKPDLVAPGEKIKSVVPENEAETMDGTSMAAPHVSGAAALLLARHIELIGNPQRVKQILCSTATDLGRERYFQGAGMLDVLRALQSV